MESGAKFLALLKRLRQKLFYASTIAALLLILYLGHRTHWKPFSHDAAVHDPHAVSKALTSPASELADGVTSPGSDESLVRITDVGLSKAGVQFGRVERRQMATSLTASGIVAYNHNVRAGLSTRAPGNVWRVEKHVGEPIRKGDVLAIIEASEVGRVKGELLQAIVQRELTQTNYQRVKQLESSVAERHKREAEAAARQAEIQVQVCAQALANLGLPVRIAELQGISDEERARRIQFLGLPESIVRSLDPLTTTANLIPLVAPFDGVVIGRDMAIGEVVSPADPHFEIADIRKVWVQLEIPKEHVNQVRIGQPIAFSPDGFGGEVRGNIDWISTEMDEKTRTLKVRAEVDNPPGGDATQQRPNYLLRAHTYGTGTIRLREKQDALVVPSEAVQFNRGTHYVFVREEGLFRSAPVELGALDHGVAEIVSGVEEGMVVATGGSHVLKAEMQITAAMR